MKTATRGNRSSAAVQAVSYTHLVAGEIKALPCRAGGQQHRSRRVPELFNDVGRVAAPVSYTHLDVYKRQIYYNVFIVKIILFQLKMNF